MFRLFTNFKVQFCAPVDRDGAVAKLRALIARGDVRGCAEADRIVLRLKGQLPHRPYQPVFRGSLEVVNGVTELHGCVRTPLGLRMFVCWSLGFAVLWTVGAYFATRGQSDIEFMPLAGLALRAFVIVFFWFINRFVSGLAATLELTLRHALEASPNKRVQPTLAEPRAADA
jgi:hypothetical protein